MTKIKYCLVTLFACGLLESAMVNAQEKLPPTEILHLMYRELTLAPDAQRTTITVPLMKRTQTEDLSVPERFALGDVYFANLQPVEAKAAFEPFMAGNDGRAAIAWQRVMQILARAEGKLDEVERMLPRYRERFPPTPAEVYGCFSQVRNVARVYERKNEHAKVVELVETEIKTLDYDAPYRSWLLPGIFYASFEQAGKAEQGLEYLHEAQRRFSAELAKNEPSNADFAAVEHKDGIFHRIEDLFYGSLAESNDPESLRSLRLKKLVEALDKQLAEIEATSENAR